VVAADGEDAEATQQVEIPRAFSVVEVLALAAAEPDVVADRFEDANHLLVEMAAVHGEALAFALRKQTGGVVGGIRSDFWGDFSGGVHGSIPIPYPAGAL
jgi:hypothetical protein